MNDVLVNSSAQVPFRRILRERELWLLLFAVVLLFARPLFTSETFFFRDLYLHFYPQKTLVAELLRNGELPLWDKYIHGGQPLMANMNNAALYPSVVLYLVLPPVAAFNFDIVLHLLAAALAAYVLGRKLGFNPAAALASGAVYGLCGMQLSLPNVWLYAAAHVPLLLMFWHLFWIERKPRWLLLTGLTGLLQVLAGRPEWPPLTWLFLLLWTLVYPYEVRVWKRAVVWLALCLCTAGLSLIQVLPMWELIKQSTGTRGSDVVAFTAWSVAPQRLPELVFPGFFGRTNSAFGGDYFGSRFEDLGFPYMLSIYFGSVTLLLAALGGVSAEDGPLPRRVRKFLLVLTGLFLILSLGKFLPGFSFLHAVPGVNLFRYPSKLLAGAMLPVSLLAGLAVHLNCFQARNARRIIFAALIFGVTLSILLLFPSFVKLLSTTYFHVAYAVRLFPAALHFTIVLVAATAIIFIAKNENARTIQTALAVLILLDLAFAGRTVNAYAPAEFLQHPPAAAKWLQPRIDNFRFYRTPTPLNLEITPRGRERFYVDRWHLDTLDSYIGAIFDLRVIFHEDLDRLGAARIQNLGRHLDSLPWDKKILILSSASIQYFISTDQIQHPAIKPIFRIKNDSNLNFYLFENLKVAPPARFCTQWLVANTRNSIPEILSDPALDLRTTVILEEPPSIPVSTVPATGALRKISEDSTHSSYAVSSASAGFVVYSETFYPGWKFLVDGEPARPYRADYAFTAVPVPAGNHVIDRLYRPRSITTGAFLSLSFAVLLTIAAAIIPRMLNNDPSKNPGGA